MARPDFLPPITADKIIIGEWLLRSDIDTTVKILEAHGFSMSRSVVIERWIELDERVYPDMP